MTHHRLNEVAVEGHPVVDRREVLDTEGELVVGSEVGWVAWTDLVPDMVQVEDRGLDRVLLELESAGDRLSLRTGACHRDHCLLAFHPHRDKARPMQFLTLLAPCHLANSSTL